VIAPAPHSVLLLALLMLLVVAPFFPARPAGFATLDLVLLLAFCAAIHSCVQGRLHRAVAISLALATWLSRALGELVDLSPLLAAYPMLGVAFLLYAATLLGQSVFGRKQMAITLDTLCGAINVYLLLGLAWGFAYTALERFAPGSFSDSAHATPLQLQTLLNFSFVTLTTLGYGNVVPATDRASSLAAAEAIVGQLYLTILVARLVGMHLAAVRSDAPSS